MDTKYIFLRVCASAFRYYDAQFTQESYFLYFFLKVCNENTLIINENGTSYFLLASNDSRNFDQMSIHLIRVLVIILIGL